MKKKKILSAILIGTFLVSSVGYTKCDNNCVRRGPNVPCGTWKKPLRTCPSYYTDPVCAAGNLACKRELVSCVVDSMIAYHVSAACVGFVVIDIEQGRGITPIAATTCALAAETIYSATESC
jgi:hypothetical protein